MPNEWVLGHSCVVVILPVNKNVFETASGSVVQSFTACAAAT